MISGLCFLCLERSSMGWLPGKRPWWGGGGWGRLWGFWWVLPWLLLVWLYRLNSGLLDCCCRALLWWWCELAALAIILFRLLTNLLVVVTRPLEAEFRSICRRAVRLSLSFFTSDIFSPNLKIIHIAACHFRNILVFVYISRFYLCILFTLCMHRLKPGHGPYLGWDPGIPATCSKKETKFISCPHHFLTDSSQNNTKDSLFPIRVVVVVVLHSGGLMPCQQLTALHILQLHFVQSQSHSFLRLDPFRMTLA